MLLLEYYDGSEALFNSGMALQIPALGMQIKISAVIQVRPSRNSCTVAKVGLSEMLRPGWEYLEFFNSFLSFSILGAYSIYQA